MPRPGPRREQVQTRFSAEQIAALDSIAAEWSKDAPAPVTRSDVVRHAVDKLIYGTPSIYSGKAK